MLEEEKSWSHLAALEGSAHLSPEAMVRANWRWFTRPAAEFAAHFDPAGEA